MSGEIEQCLEREIASLKKQLAECQGELVKARRMLNIAEDYIATNIPIGIVACDCKEK